jgi:uncharacterized protein (TIGR02594 family)
LERTGPEWLHLAREELGTKERPGSANNPAVVQYYVDSIGGSHPDSVPWCSAFVGSCLARAGYKSSRSLMARSYLTYGRKLKEPVPGAIVVFARGRPPSGHVAFVESVSNGMLTVIGGNQSDAVTRSRYSRTKALGYRWPVR